MPQAPQTRETDFSLQYTEYWQGRTGLTIGVEALLFEGQSDYQWLAVYETDTFGKVLTLDGVIQFSEFDEFVYHEMLAHPALCLLKQPRKVLIIGGGDGGVAREVLKHPSVKRLELVDIDALVPDVSQRFFPALRPAFEDARLDLRIADGLAYVKEAEAGSYDYIVVDSTDPVGISEGLFGRDFYEDCLKLLTPQGMLAVQSESPFDPVNSDIPGRVRGFFRELFPIAETYLAFIPTYVAGMWSFTLGSKALHPLKDFDAAQAEATLGSFAEPLRYYTPELHRAAFALPAFVKAGLKP